MIDKLKTWTTMLLATYYEKIYCTDAFFNKRIFTHPLTCIGG